MQGIFHDLTAVPSAIPLGVALVRLSAACVLGAAIGAEREWRQKPAGLRTHILVSVGACLFCLLMLELISEAAAIDARNNTAAVRADPVRVIEAVTAGVAFLAAGTILTGNGRVRGLTTGAEMWVAGAIGVACGIGQLPLAGLSAGLVLIVMIGVRWLEVRGPKKRHSAEDD